MSEMNELFYQDAYLRTFEAEVLSCTEGKKGYEIELSDTAFYPEGGGQPADHGMLGDAVVNDVRTKEGKILHFTDRPLEVGSTVCGAIDWERRFDHMQNHSGEHIVSGLIHQAYGYENVGFHLGDEEILIDFDGMLKEEQVCLIEDRANALIQADVETVITFPDEEERSSISYRSKKELSGVVRLVEFPGGDLCACCGTHVKRTGEIGLVKITSFEKHKNGVRLHLLCGNRALKDYRMQASQNAEISHLLSARTYETSSAVARLQEENNKLSRLYHNAVKQLLEGKAEQFAKKEAFLLVFEEDLDTNTLREYANLLKEKTEDETIAVVCKTAEQMFTYIILSTTLGLRQLAREMNQRLNGRGGGKDEMIQGTFAAHEEEIRNVLEELLHG